MSRAPQYEWMVPRRWYNIVPDLPKPLPPYLKPNGEPVGPRDFEVLFAKELAKQEFSGERWIDIPQEVREVYLIWRPTPLIRAKRLEAALKTPARIYYKFEGVSPPGSHKPNTAVAQLYYISREGVDRVTTETGAGQWGSSVAFAASLFGVKATVYMVRASYLQKPYRRVLMELWGADAPFLLSGRPGGHGAPGGRWLLGRGRARRFAGPLGGFCPDGAFPAFGPFVGAAPRGPARGGGRQYLHVDVVHTSIFDFCRCGQCDAYAPS